MPSALSQTDHVLEIAAFDILPGMENAFETAIGRAAKLISSAQGYMGHQIRRSVENERRYLLLVQWRRLEDHTVSFRQSPAAAECRALTREYLSSPPSAEHAVIIQSEEST